MKRDQSKIRRKEGRKGLSSVFSWERVGDRGAKKKMEKWGREKGKKKKTVIYGSGKEEKSWGNGGSEKTKITNGFYFFQHHFKFLHVHVHVHLFTSLKGRRLCSVYHMHGESERGWGKNAQRSWLFPYGAKEKFHSQKSFFELQKCHLSFWHVKGCGIIPVEKRRKNPSTLYSTCIWLT